jgi:hypothetical protein
MLYWCKEWHQWQPWSLLWIPFWWACHGVVTTDSVELGSCTLSYDSPTPKYIAACSSLHTTTNNELISQWYDQACVFAYGPGCPVVALVALQRPLALVAAHLAHLVRGIAPRWQAPLPGHLHHLAHSAVVAVVIGSMEGPDHTVDASNEQSVRLEKLTGAAQLLDHRQKYSLDELILLQRGNNVVKPIDTLGLTC